jgi:hypothetical protein
MPPPVQGAVDAVGGHPDDVAWYCKTSTTQSLRSGQSRNTWATPSAVWIERPSTETPASLPQLSPAAPTIPTPRPTVSAFPPRDEPHIPAAISLATISPGQSRYLTRHPRGQVEQWHHTKHLPRALRTGRGHVERTRSRVPEMGSTRTATVAPTTAIPSRGAPLTGVVRPRSYHVSLPPQGSKTAPAPSPPTRRSSRWVRPLRRAIGPAGDRASH